MVTPTSVVIGSKLPLGDHPAFTPNNRKPSQASIVNHATREAQFAWRSCPADGCNSRCFPCVAIESPASPAPWRLPPATYCCCLILIGGRGYSSRSYGSRLKGTGNLRGFCWIQRQVWHGIKTLIFLLACVTNQRSAFATLKANHLSAFLIAALQGTLVYFMLQK